VREPVERRAWFALVLASSTSMVVGIAVTAVNVAFPAIEDDFAGSSRSTLSWGITGYGITLASLMLLGGRLADHLGRRRIYRTGVAVFVMASLALALAPAAWVFVGARLGQAVGAALSAPASLTLVIERFPASRRLSAISTWTGLGTLGAAVGPSLSAVVTQALGWRWIFVLPLVAAAAAYVLAPRLLPEGLPTTPAAGRIDVLGCIIGTLGVAAVAALITEVPQLGWAHPLVVGCLLTAVVLLPWFVRRSRRHPEPLLDLHLFSAPNVSSVNLVNLGLTGAGTAGWLLYPLLMVQHWHWGLMRTGLALTPFPLFASGVGIVAGRLAERFGTRRVMAYGALLPAIGMGWQALWLDGEPRYFLALAPGAALFNIGFGIVYSPMVALGLRGVDQAQMGQATAVFNSIRQLGGALSVATVIAIVGNADVIPVPSFRWAMTAVTGMALLAGVVVLTRLRVPPELRSGVAAGAAPVP
jgi:EmrB/QacA subfamily drug resistance transporter